MKKINYSIDGLDSKFGGIIGNNSWSLCIGAGISYGLVPTWMELARKVFNSTYSFSYGKKEFKNLVDENGFGLDSWFQNCLNYITSQNLPESHFYDILREELYKDLLKRAEKDNLKNQIIHGLHNPLTHFTPKEVDSLYNFFEENYGDSSNNEVTRVLVEAFGTRKEPNSIISLNADAILNLTIYLKQQYLSLKFPKSDVANFTRRKIKRVIHSTEMTGKKKKSIKYLPLYHLHGCLFPLVEDGQPMKRIESLNKLIFDETSYINMAGSVYSWAQSTFLFHSQADDIIFIGMSMTDNNIRKWLAWTQTNKLNEIQLIKGKTQNHLRHLWITTRPKKKEHENILAQSVQHLGVRVAFIDDWSQLGNAMNNLLGIRKKKIHNLLAKLKK